MPVVNDHELKLMQPERARLHQLRQPLWRRVNEVRRRLALAQEVNLLLQLLVLGEGVLMSPI